MVKILILILIPLYANGQKEGSPIGIKFEQELNWEQIKAKAQKENKFIFVDCYATWCLPCKLMDRNVYVEEQVAAAVNDSFISVKIQMDTSKNDSENVKRLYGVAQELKTSYNINALPTFLFFAPDGKVVHKDVGSKTPKEFIALTKEAINPTSQYYNLINDYLSGRMGYTTMPAFIQKLTEYKEDSLATIVARDYMHNYLEKMPDSAFFKKETLIFFASHLSIISSGDRISKVYFTQPHKVDSIMSNNGHARDCLNRIIRNKEIKPALDKARNSQTTPQWNNIYAAIKNKYNDDYAFNNIIDVKLNWHYNNQEWANWLSSVMDKWKNSKQDFPKYDWLYLNFLAWTVCVHSNNRNELTTALKWVEMGISKTQKAEVPILDTKANLLYKIGNTREAVAIHTKIIETLKSELRITSNDEDKINIPINIEYYQNLITKMKKGQHINFTD